MTAAPRVLVTGARGFVGRHCLAGLARRGYDVVALTSGNVAGGRDGATWVAGDLLAPGVPERVIGEVRPTHLLHLAWYTKSPEYWQAACNADWARVSADLVRAFVTAGGRRAVAAGTCAEYAWLGETCAEGRTPLRPATPYGEMKHRTHGAIAAIAGEAGIPYAWARFFFVYGPGEEASKLISASARRIRAGEAVSLAQPDRRLDFVHAGDVGEALAGLVDSEAEGPFNVGTGTGTSTREVVEALGAALGAHPTVECGGGPAEPDVVADVERLSLVLPWLPRTVREGVHSIVEGYVS